MLVNKIQDDLKAALKSGDKTKISALRYLLAEIRNRQIAMYSSQNKSRELTDEEVISAIKFQIKQRQEAIALYRQGKRDALVAKERQETEVLSTYVPQGLSLIELEKIVKEAIAMVKPVGQKDFGKVMGVAMSKTKGRADGSVVAELVKKFLI